MPYFLSLKRFYLTLLHSEQPNFHRLAVLSAIGLRTSAGILCEKDLIEYMKRNIRSGPEVTKKNFSCSTQLSM